MPEQLTADRRVTRTKRLLLDALMDLIEERGLEGLTVRDLTEKAGLNRGTFYLHYKDIPDLLEQSKEEMISGIFRVASHAMQSPEAQKACPTDVPHPVTLRTFNFLYDNARFFSVMLGPNGDPSFMSKWKKLMLEQIHEKSLVYQPKDSNLPIPRDYLVAYIVSAHFGILQHWFETGMKLPPLEMAKLMSQLNYLGPKRIFESDKT